MLPELKKAAEGHLAYKLAKKAIWSQHQFFQSDYSGCQFDEGRLDGLFNGVRRAYEVGTEDAKSAFLGMVEMGQFWMIQESVFKKKVKEIKGLWTGVLERQQEAMENREISPYKAPSTCHNFKTKPQETRTSSVTSLLWKPGRPVSRVAGATNVNDSRGMNPRGKAEFHMTQVWNSVGLSIQLRINRPVAPWNA